MNGLRIGSVCFLLSVRFFVVFAQTRMTDAVRQRILEENEGLAKQALRCLAIAVKTEDLRELESYDGVCVCVSV